MSIGVIATSQNPKSEYAVETCIISECEKATFPTFGWKSNSDRIFYYQGMLLADFKEPGVHINGQNPYVSIKNKRLGNLANGITHVVQKVQDLLNPINIEVLQQPSYIPDLARPIF